MKKRKTDERIPSSFRDPSGFVSYRDSSLYSQVNAPYKDDYAHLMRSGLYEALVDAEFLIPHEEVNVTGPEPDQTLKIITPELLPFISYPYEWCFSELKDAALTVLEIQQRAFDFGMGLKDCSATISSLGRAALYSPTRSPLRNTARGSPGLRIGNSANTSLAPLALMSYRDVRLNQLLRIYVDGIPLDLASSLLPFRTRLAVPLLSHIHLYAKSQKHFTDKTVDSGGREMGRLSFRGLIDNLESAVKELKWQPKDTEWVDHCEGTNYPSDALRHKRQIVAEFLSEIEPENVWDLEANVGMFSRIASDRRIRTLSFDADHATVERSYLQCVERNETHILRLLLDLTNPSPSIG